MNQQIKEEILFGNANPYFGPADGPGAIPGYDLNSDQFPLAQSQFVATQRQESPSRRLPPLQVHPRQQVGESGESSILTIRKAQTV